MVAKALAGPVAAKVVVAVGLAAAAGAIGAADNNRELPDVCLRRRGLECYTTRHDALGR